MYSINITHLKNIITFLGLQKIRISFYGSNDAAKQHFLTTPKHTIRNLYVHTISNYLYGKENIFHYSVNNYIIQTSDTHSDH